jgi:hypothetical protein
MAQNIVSWVRFGFLAKYSVLCDISRIAVGGCLLEEIVRERLPVCFNNLLIWEISTLANPQWLKFDLSPQAVAQILSQDAVRDLRIAF